MPAGDITHPVPDLTGYITEGQIVLSAEVYARNVYPPVDPLSSLSRLMRRGAGKNRTREDHLDLAAQLIAALSRARQVRELVELVGSAALGERSSLPATGRGVRVGAGQPTTRREPYARTDPGPRLACGSGVATAGIDHAAGCVARRALGSRRAGTMIAPGGMRIPPGRAGRLWLERRLATAQHAGKLLTQKLAILNREEQRLVQRAEEGDRAVAAAVRSRRPGRCAPQCYRAGAPCG